MNKYLVGTCAFNEGEKILRVLEGFCDYSLYDVIAVNDGSHDGSFHSVKSHQHLTTIHNETNRGAGYCVRQIIKYAKENGYTAVFFVSGNNKDVPGDLQKLKEGLEEGFDVVQGSRYLPSGVAGGDMPLYRRIATRIHPFLFSLLCRRRITDSTNGFRALRLSLLEDKRINIDQPWLDRYEMEPYLFYKAVTLGYRIKEVPVSKIYPPRCEGQTKMAPVSGWWSILRPLFLLGLGFRK